MPSNHTTNYQLSQWEKSDKVLMEDFNADNAKIDAALKAHAATLAGLTAAAPKHGNCQICTITYTGDGTYGQEHPVQLTFPYPPILVICYSEGSHITLVQNCGRANYPSHQPSTVTWSGNTVSFYSANAYSQMNDTGRRYYVTALCSRS